MVDLENGLKERVTGPFPETDFGGAQFRFGNANVVSRFVLAQLKK